MAEEFCFGVLKMSGLSETERDGCTKILKLIPKGDLLSLCDTVTNKLIVVENARGMSSICDRYRKLARIPLPFVTFHFLMCRQT